MDGVCASQLMEVEACVEADPGGCSCFGQPFNETFPAEMGGAYRTTMAFEIPGTEFFCQTANENVCMALEKSGSCCCQPEVTSYLDCSFTSDWGPSFGAGDCPFDKCGAGEETEDGGGSMMIIIIAVSVAVLCCCCMAGCFFWRRRRRRNATEDKGSKKSKGTSNDEDSSCSSANDIETASRKSKKSIKKKSRADSDSDESVNRRKTKRRVDSDSDDSESRRPKGRSKSRSDSDSEGDSRRHKHRPSRRNINHDSDSDSESRRSRRGKGSRAASRRRLDDSESEDEGSRYSRRSRMTRGSSKRRFDNEYDSEDRRYSRPPPKTVEESVRQARTILKTVKKTESNEDGVTVEVQQVMNAELSEMIAQLKKQKEEAEQRLRNSETEATRLRIEKEASARHIAELENKNMMSQHDLMLTQQEAHQLHAHNTLTVAESEAETIRVAAELEQVRREREAMSKMIAKLEKAKSNMESKLHEVQDEASILREENAVAMHHVQMAHGEKLELQEKLANIQNARADIERRLLEAELEANSLRALKKAKAHDIRAERTSAHVRPSYLNEMEAERKAISKDLQMMEEEKAQMQEILAKLDSSRQQIASLLEGDDADDEESIALAGLFDTGNDYESSRAPVSTGTGRYQPALSTIQSPRRLRQTTDLSNESFNNLQHSMLVDPSYQIRLESARLREKRGNARKSEQKLRQTMDNSRSAKSMGSVGSSLSGSFSTGLSAGSYHSNTQW